MFGQGSILNSRNLSIGLSGTLVIAPMMLGLIYLLRDDFDVWRFVLFYLIHGYFVLPGFLLGITIAWFRSLFDDLIEWYVKLIFAVPVIGGQIWYISSFYGDVNWTPM